LIHKKCNEIYTVRPNDFQQGNRCPKCQSVSNGEDLIRSILDKHDIEYYEEITFNEYTIMRNKRFDFMIKLNDIEYLIEYDGRQHFNGKNSKYGSYELMNNDHIKNEFCKVNSINLIRIPYTLIDYIDTILNDLLMGNDLTVLLKYNLLI